MRRIALLWLQAALTIAPWLLQADPFYLRPKIEQPPEMGELLSYVFVAGANTYSFVPPHEWQVGAEPEAHRVVLEAPDRAANICIVVRSREPGLPLVSDADVLRKEIMSRFADAQMAEEFPSYTSSHQGRGFQIRWIVAGRVPMVSRVACFPVKGGTIEFTLTTNASRFSNFQAAFGSLLTSFQNCPAAALAQP